MSSTCRSRPWSSGKAFCTACKRTTGGVCSILCYYSHGQRPGEPQLPGPATRPRLEAVLPNGDRIHRHANTTPEPQGAECEEKLIGLVLRQLVQVENFDDVGATVPEKIDVQRQPRKPIGFPDITRWQRRT